MLIIEGHRREVRPKGWTAWQCNQCKRVLPFRVYDRHASHSFYFVEVWSSHDIFAVCNFCENAIGFSERPRILQKWNEEMGVQALVDATCPELGQVDAAVKPTETQMKALLNSLSRWAGQGNYTQEVGLGIVAGGILGIPIGMGIGWLLHKMGAMNNIKEGQGLMIGLFAFGCCIGCAIAGWIYDARRRYRRRLRQALEGAIERHQLDVTVFLNVAQASSHPSVPVLEAMLND